MVPRTIFSFVSSCGGNSGCLGSLLFIAKRAGGKEVAAEKQGSFPFPAAGKMDWILWRCDCHTLLLATRFGQF